MATPFEPDARITEAIRTASAARAEALARRPLVLGICGAQGSGKSTLAAALVREAELTGVSAASLSLDDLYRTRKEREALAADVHPLLRTRGVPGTHDVALGLSVLAALDRGEPALLPRFDKAQDDRRDPASWDGAPEGCELLVFEGWCLGAAPEPAASLQQPINDLEAREDPDARWRTYANRALAGDYQRLFARIDLLVLLAAPSFDIVLDWRLQQETELRESSPPDTPGLMDAAGIARFIQHYERLTRHILAEMPGRADIVIRLSENRTPIAINRRRADPAC